MKPARPPLKFSVCLPTLVTLIGVAAREEAGEGLSNQKKKKKIHLSSLSQHHSVSFCLFITHNSSPSRSLCIRREGVRAIYFTVLYMLLI